MGGVTAHSPGKNSPGSYGWLPDVSLPGAPEGQSSTMQGVNLQPRVGKSPAQGHRAGGQQS